MHYTMNAVRLTKYTADILFSKARFQTDSSRCMVVTLRGVNRVIYNGMQL